MSHNSISLTYEGKVSPKDVSALVSNFAALVQLLTDEIADTKDIDWEVAKFQGGSATLTFSGTHTQPQNVQVVVRAWEEIGASVKSGTQVPYSDKIKKHIDGITKQLNGRVTAAHFVTHRKHFTIQSGDVVPQLPVAKTFAALGSVKGRVETISIRREPRLVVYDHIFDKAVTCHLEPERKKELLDYMDKEVLVSGKVTRDARTGQAKSIREISNIEEVFEFEVDPDSYKETKGSLAWMGAEPAEKMIKRAWNG